MLGFWLMAAGAPAVSPLNQSLNGATLLAQAISLVTATSSVTVNSNGNLTFVGTSTSPGTTWASGSYSDYEVQVTATGDAITGTTGSYLDPTQTWTLTRSIVGESAASLSVTIRGKANPADSIAFTVNLSSTVFTLD